MMSSCSSLRPPSSSLYPLVALDTFLQQQLLASSTNKDNDGGGNDNKELTLRVADNLFGSTLLEGALTTLESCTITEIQAVISRRRMFIIAKRRRQQQHPRQKPDEEQHKYFCLLPQQQQQQLQCQPVQPDNDNRMDEGNSANNFSSNATEQPTNQWKGFLFCSCRAYFERTKSMSSTPQSSVVVCKHLLALKLRSALLPSSPSESQYQKTETATEEEFSQQVLKLLLAGAV